MILEHKDYVTEWRPFDGFNVIAVRIWFRETMFGLYQRHEWQQKDGSFWKDDWIKSTGKKAPPTSKPIGFNDPLVEALEKIAEGHNDPRSLARETLKEMRQEKVR